MGALLLGMDTALGGMSLSLCQGPNEIAGIRHATRNDQAAQLLPCLEILLREAGANYSDLSAIVVTVGPGGFTGVRIGLATARALGFAAAKPVRGITTLALMAQKATPNWRRFVCALPAGREQVYVQGFGEQPAFPEACMASIAEIATLAAEGMPCVITEQPWIEALPAQSERLFHDTTENAYLACQWAWHTPQDTSCAPLPLYIRPPDAKPQAPLF